MVFLIKNKSISYKIARIGIFSALCIIISAIEMFIPPIIPVPFFKIGFANVIVLAVLFTMGFSYAFFISCIRILVQGFLFKSPIGFIMSAVAGIVSILVMACAKKSKLPIISISVIGSICHNMAQLAVASVLFNLSIYTSFAPLFIIIGIFSGVATGAISYIINERFKVMTY